MEPHSWCPTTPPLDCLPPASPGSVCGIIMHLCSQMGIQKPWDLLSHSAASPCTSYLPSSGLCPSLLPTSKTIVSAGSVTRSIANGCHLVSLPDAPPRRPGRLTSGVPRVRSCTCSGHGFRFLSLLCAKSTLHPPSLRVHLPTLC